MNKPTRGELRIAVKSLLVDIGNGVEGEYLRDSWRRTTETVEAYLSERGPDTE